MKALFENTKTLLAAFAISVGLGGAAAAQDNVATNDVDATTVSLEQTEYASLDTDDAEIESRGRVLLHFGEGFDEITRGGIIGALEQLNYNFTVAEGGPENMMDLYIDGQKGKRPFSAEDAFKYLVTVLERNASRFRLANNDSENPTFDAG